MPGSPKIKFRGAPPAADWLAEGPQSRTSGHYHRQTQHSQQAAWECGPSAHPSVTSTPPLTSQCPTAVLSLSLSKCYSWKGFAVVWSNPAPPLSHFVILNSPYLSLPAVCLWHYFEIATNICCFKCPLALGHRCGKNI